MSQLKRQIRQLELDIAANNIYLKEKTQELETEMPTYAALFAVGASVLIGYVVARKKSLATLVRQSILLFFRTKLWTRKIRRFL